MCYYARYCIKEPFPFEDSVLELVIFYRCKEYLFIKLEEIIYCQNIVIGRLMNKGLFISPSGISGLCSTITKTDTAERSISTDRETLQVCNASSWRTVLDSAILCFYKILLVSSMLMHLHHFIQAVPLKM
jgi:hypothetical protein